MDPDEFPAQDAAGAAAGGPRLPDLHGSVAVSSDGTHHAHFLAESRAAAQQNALDYCRSQSGGECSLGPSFKNQCIAIAVGQLGQARVLGQPEWTQAQTLATAMSKCAQTQGGPCTEVISACSTYAELAAQRNRQDAEGREQVSKALGDALRILFEQAGNSR